MELKNIKADFTIKIKKMINISKTCIAQAMILVVFLILHVSCKVSETNIIARETGSYTDPRDGKVYKTVKIGDQWIMAENLAYKPDRGNYRAYDNDSDNVSKYGYLYDWETAKKVAPEGWHLPSNKEWKTLRKALGGKRAVWKYSQKIYKPMMHGGSSGFNALLGGLLDCNGKFRYLNERADFWSSSDSNFDGPWHFGIDSNKDSIPHGSADSKKGGFAGLKSYECYGSGKSVRLFKD
ncbi:MAG: FISUMP domain-containing protein [Bacteroidales bacterium]|nr:FISUMP domain-containing protein [Bacteroidales bacterium]